MKQMLRRLLTGGLGRPPWDFPGRRSGERYVVLVRPAVALGAGSHDADPPLSAEGRAQAEELAGALAALGPLPIISAPLRRAAETAEPLARRWGTQVSVEPVLVGPGRTDDDGDLDAPPGHDEWRARLLGFIGALSDDTVVVADLDVIDVVTAAATGDRHGLDRSPGPASRTTIRLTGGGIQVLRTAAGPGGDGGAERAGVKGEVQRYG